jgi:hypothetical protein
MWELRREYASQRDGVWAVFRSHEEVCNSSYLTFLPSLLSNPETYEILNGFPFMVLAVVTCRVREPRPDYFQDPGTLPRSTRKFSA